MANHDAVWVWDNDGDLAERSRVWIEIDYASCTIDELEFWDATEPVKSTGRLVYSASEAAFKRLQNYDFFPLDRALPVVTARLRQAIESICSDDEVAFHPCEISTKKSKQVMEAWNLYPLRHIKCIDKNASDAEWDLRFKDEPRLKEAKRIVFKPDCLSGNNIARIREGSFWIVVSDKLKSLIEGVNSKGIKFYLPEDSSIGNNFKFLLK